MIKFIDISEHNTILALDKIKDSNLKGIIMKATEGTTYIDHIVDIFYTALKGTNNIGFYHYLTSTSSPITQAQNFWNKIKDKQYQIIPVLDVEDRKLGNNAEYYSVQFIAEFKRLSGQKMLIYSGRYFIEEHFTKAFKKNNFWWVADYSAKDLPQIEDCNIVAWQYTSSSHEYRFALGDLDVSILYNEDNFFLNKKINSTNLINYIGVLQAELNTQGNKLIVDGIAGNSTLTACHTLSKGATGNITKWVQKQLKITCDGIFGEKTRQAILLYQKNNSLVCDGIIGIKTWHKLLGM